jgi:hypothetical protein
MIIRENITIDGREFVRTTSDERRYVVREGIAYSEAIDPVEYAQKRVYTEGEIIPDDEVVDPDESEI